MLQKLLLCVDLMTALISVEDSNSKLVFHHLTLEKITSEFNYKAAVPLEDTLQQMIKWIRKHGGEKGKAFEYHLNLEFVKENTPKTWTEKLI